MLRKKLKYLFSGGILVIFGIPLFLFLQGVSAHSADSDGNFPIHMTDEGFFPDELVIQRGDTVVFENTGENDHWPASNIHPTHRMYPGSDIEKCGTAQEHEAFDACKGVAPGGSYSFAFEQKGIWRFHDHLHPELGGKITVKENIQAGSKELEAEPKGFFGQIFEAIKNFFARLFGFPSQEEKENREESADKAGPMREYDELIQEDSTEIFQNKNALYSYVKKFGPAQSTQHLHKLQSLYGNCHESAHDAGNFSYEIYGAKAFQLCSAECHSGCYHGATEAFFRDHGTASLASDLKTICSSELNPFFSHQCIHGIGHGLMAWANYEIFDALESCDLLPGSRESCYSGVYMENIVGGLSQEQGHTTQYLNDDPHFPCSIVEEKYKAACYFYQTSRMAQLFSGNFSKVASTCSEAAAMYHRSCFESMGRDVGGTHRGNPEGAINACSNAAAGNPRIWCLTGAVQDAFWDPSGQDAAIAFCKLLTDKTEKDACYATLFGRAPDVLAEKEARAWFCGKTEAEYQEKCRSKIL